MILKNPLVTMGVDPGWAKTGVAVLTKLPGEFPRVERTAIIETTVGGKLITPKKKEMTFGELMSQPKKKQKRKRRFEGRVADDDMKRMLKIWTRLRELLTAYKPSVLVVEHYAPWPGAMGGNAWKTALGYQLALCSGFAVEWVMQIRIARPDDLKRAFLGRTSGTKEDIIAAIPNKVVGLKEVLATKKKVWHEHIVDAVGHAYFGLIDGENNA